MDSNSEDSDSDMSDVPGLDSDVEREKQKNYSRTLYKEDAAKLKKLMKDDLKPGDKRKRAPADGLKLKYVHGYGQLHMTH